MPAQTELARLAERLAMMETQQRLDVARAAGVDALYVHRAADTAGRTNVRAFEGGIFVSLCAAVGIDPHTGDRLTDEPLAVGPFVWEHLACGVRLTRALRRLNQRAAAKTWGVEKTAISRIENSIPVSIDPLLDLCDAIGRHPFEFLRPSLFHVERKLHQRSQHVEKVSA